MYLKAPVIAAILLASAATALAVDMRVDGTLAPNIYGSPSFSAWSLNAQNAVMNGLNTLGTAGPTQFNTITNAPLSWNIVTGFNSWLGKADPGSVFGPAFASELGNRASFPLFIDGQGSKISISDLSFTMMSSDPGNLLGWNYGVGTYNYSSDYRGIIYNTDGSITWVTSGPNTQLVDAIVGRGSGNSFAVYTTDPGATLQDKIDTAVAGLTSYDFTGTYTFDGVSKSSTIHFSVPDGGSTLLMLSTAFLGLMALGTMKLRARA